MGLLDILNGMQNGPRGAPQPGQGGMSPLTMALIGLLAYKAIKHYTAQPGAAPAPAPAPDTTSTGGLGNILGGNLGGLGGALGGTLGGMLAGGAAGSVLSGGLNDLIKQFENSGHGDIAKSWVGNGPNKSISPADVEKTIGGDTLKSLAEQAGVSEIELASHLSENLPDLVNQLTPQGRLPTGDELARWI